MSSPDRMEMLAEAMEHLIDAVRLMNNQQQARDERMRELDEQSRETQGRINYVIDALTQRQPDIRRIAGIPMDGR